MSAPSSDPPERGALGLVLLLGGLTAIGPLSIDAYLPALPEIARDLHASAAATQLTLSTFFLGLASAQLVWGPLADRLGRRRPLAIGLVLFVIGAVACALAPTIELLAAARFVQAVGGSAGMVVTRAVVRDRWSGRDAARIMSLLVLVMGAAPVLAPSLGSALLAVAGWRAIFVALAVFGVLALVATQIGLRDVQAPRAPEPIAHAAKQVLRDRVFVTAALGGGFAQAGLFAYIAGSSFVFIEHHGMAPATYAWIFGANAAGYVLSAQVNRRALMRAEPGEIARAAIVVTLVIGVVLRLTAIDGTALVHASLIWIYVATLGLTNPNATAVALEHQHARAGLASALLGTMQLAIAAASSAAVGLLSDGTPRAMTTVMLACAAVSLVFLFRAHALARVTPAA
ncbi:multidrug effflux MFS transporter [Sandaracinus amylolyticus]|uniref:multidrug effflux MFS transporter n=1 Tax=Sandaracinus amylolyticus TaxID=927083 RepID=UPI001F330E41|nr:multidrug effflux MFS transporter [Sandaracinus amylolyticus]UJR84052.1 Hypothetical protein I5071_61230 [Sandaracinus amylolyticus]